MSLPNLAGVAPKGLVESIGTGKFTASYINWSRTMNLLREHAPGWMVDYVPAADGSLLHRAPVGGYLMICFKHIDGTATPAVPQAVMDHRNNAIPFDKITARDISDTQRRGMCLAAAMTFGLAYELWAKLPMESGYAPQSAAEDTATEAPVKTAKPAATEETFRETALEMGVDTKVIDILVDKLGGNYQSGLNTLAKTNAAALNEKYGNW